MPRPRKSLVSLEATPYYHCVSRCVRRAFLCGRDEVSGKCYEHRRQWIEDRLLMLAGIFAIDIAAYAIMHNHYHVVLHIDRARAEQWSVAEVIERWHRVFRGNMLSQRFATGETLSKTEHLALDEIVREWRQRLISISWFMRCVNEPVARDANREDEVSGRFWEGRFRSQALLDEKALIACMAYVDLNPIRAKIARTPEESSHTSIYNRINRAIQTRTPEHICQQPENLQPFVGNPQKQIPDGLPFALKDYLELVEWSGRILREDKRGTIDGHLPGILQRLRLDDRQFTYLSRHFESPFRHLVGAAHVVRKTCEALGLKWVHGIKHCETFFSSS